MTSLAKYTFSICLASISIYSFAQKPAPLDKATKKLLPGLSYIPPKDFTSLIHTGIDSASSSYKPRNVSVHGFYISQTEVTNKEYRDFIHYVRDSIAHHLLGHLNDNGIDWKQNIDWNDTRLDVMMTPPDQRVFGRKEVDPAKLLIAIDHFGRHEIITVYPDTLRWMTDFNYSSNEALVKRYFSHVSYNNYPVVGVSLKQAMAFCQWKTNQLGGNVILRLPTNAEWESAAREEKDSLKFVSNEKGYRCNFGTVNDRNGVPTRRNNDDGFFYTSPVKSFPSEAHELFDMKGNVSEWTCTSMDEIMNVEVKEGKEKRMFIVKGGGWNSTPYYLQPGVCQFYNADVANTWIGFRYVVEVKKR